MSDSSSNVHPNASLAAQQAPTPRAQATNQELALMADRITDAVLVCDAQRCIRWANPAFTRLTGYTLEDAYGRQVEELLSGPQTDAEAVRRINQWISQGEGVERVAMCQHHKDGDAFWVERTVQPLPGPDGAVDRYIEILTDLHAQRWAQQEHHSRLEAEVALARRTTFLGQLSLGMRGPLNTIVGFSQLLDMDIQAGPDARRQVGNIQQAAQQLIHLLDKAVKLANAEDRALPVHAQRVNLLAVSKETSHALEAAARERRVTLVIEGDGPTAWADPVHVRDVLTQVLRFAISHCPADNTVWVSCRHSPDHGRALIEVNHPGGDGLLPGGDAGRLFEPFKAVPNNAPSARQGQSVDELDDHGMGLAIAQRLAELMNGGLGVTTALGKGVMFTLNLPLADRLVSPPAAPSAAHPPAGIELPPLRIIHVEDNALNRSLVEALFAAYPQVQLSSFATASQGLAAIQGEMPDVGLVDINLPDGSGLDLCRTLRASPLTRRVPLIALSGDALPDHIARALQAGFNHYLVKPIQLQRLLGILAGMPANPPPR
ncbi:PAS domain-containing hybrid sensor histidine kinase/response regulator [Aquabacterium soli]|uniref:histidine kinase n=1 Tax=Aquabacterium soli TaxID=2493092 RepID=A0A426V6F7_9BURK|nr:response regulator [Aquabacterium soli]RRS02435.1 PAS domain-containing hybrid sensor histidine kinase/response regulator [Aquabacterium soli]